MRINIHRLFVVLTYFLSSQQGRQCIARTTKRLRSVGAFRGNERFHVCRPSERDAGSKPGGYCRECPGTRRCEFYDPIKIVVVIGGTSRLVKLILEIS